MAGTSDRVASIPDATRKQLFSQNAACVECRDSLAACREHLQLAVRMVARVQHWLEAEAVRVDACIRDMIGSPEDRYATSPRRLSSRGEAVVTSARASQRSDRYWDVHFDAAGPWLLPSMLGQPHKAADTPSSETSQSGNFGAAPPPERIDTGR